MRKLNINTNGHTFRANDLRHLQNSIDLLGTYLIDLIGGVNYATGIKVLIGCQYDGSGNRLPGYILWNGEMYYFPGGVSPITTAFFRVLETLEENSPTKDRDGIFHNVHIFKTFELVAKTGSDANGVNGLDESVIDAAPQLIAYNSLLGTFDAYALKTILGPFTVGNFGGPAFTSNFGLESSGGTTVRFYKDQFSMVGLEGTAVKITNTTGNLPIFTLPLAYRPSLLPVSSHLCVNLSTNTPVVVNVDRTTGNVILTASGAMTTNQILSLSGIRYKAQ